MILSLVPLAIFVWMARTFSWVVAGTTVEGQFSYFFGLPGPGGTSRDDLQVAYRLGQETRRINPGRISDAQLHRLGMPDSLRIVPGKPAFTAPVPVRIIHIAGFCYAEPIFPWTWVWKYLGMQGALLLVAVLILAILHGELFRSIVLDYRLVRCGTATRGRIRTTHETGWWEDSLDYIRRCYVDYSFPDPATGRECRGCQLTLGAVDPACLPPDWEVTVLYDPACPEWHIVYEFTPFKTREGYSRS